MKNKATAASILFLLLSIFYFAGTLTFLRPCAPMEDGSFMHCHIAGVALSLLAAGQLLTAVGLLFLKNRAGKIAAALLSIVFSICMLLLPGRVITLCMMPEMRCRAIMRPGAIVFAILFLICACLLLFLQGKKENR